MKNQINKPKYWEEKYLALDTSWDLGGPTPIFVRLAGEYPPGKLCIVGCGRGYDAIHFAKAGFEVTAVDFSESAIRAVEELATKEKVKVAALCEDIFNLSDTHANYFDYVIEQTCYCAIDPLRRGDYERTIREILKPGGHLIGLWFPLDKTPEMGGPPYAVNIPDVKAMFNQGWQLSREEFPVDSVLPRQGREKLIVFKKSFKPI